MAQERQSENGWRLDPLALGLLAGHIALVCTLSATAWPEITTPAYLWSRGLVLYRDVKFQHAPGAMGALALAFLLFGPSTWVVRAFAAAGPLVAHAFLLRETRRFRPSTRIASSAFFVVGLLSFDGFAVWPTVLMTALAIPIANALGTGRFRRAGLLIGVAILLKQTAAFLLVLAAVHVALRRGARQAGLLFLAGCLPYVATVLVLGFFGAAGDMLRWTILVPFTIRPPEYWLKSPYASWLSMLLLAFVPTVVEALIEKEGERPTSARWHLTVAVGFALIAFPRASVYQTVAALPALAVGAARLLERPGARLRAAVLACVITWTVSRAAIVGMSEHFDGKVIDWNDEPPLDRLAEALRRLPPGTPLHSELWQNVLPRCGLLPPGRIYVNPWLPWFFPVDNIGERVRRAAQAPGTAVVDFRGPGLVGETVGPYVIVRK